MPARTPAKEVKKWLKRISFFLFVTFAVFGVLIFVDYVDYQQLTSRRTLDRAIIKSDWLGNPLDQEGRFMNDEFPFLPRLIDLIRWRLSENPFEAEKRSDTDRIEVRDPSEFLASNREGILWLGHASMFIRVGGVSILIDPVFGEPTFLRRLVPVESPLEKITAIDFVLLSHDHRDHMDEATLRSIAQKFPDSKFLAGIGSEELLSEWAGSERVKTAGWFQKFFKTAGDGVSIYFLPVRHWSRRGLFDTNERLWGGYVIESGDTRIYFGGDSGYGRHYRDVAEIFPDLDYFIIGIGAYEPRWFMEPNHNSPTDALKAFADSGARYMIPMHHSTFDLSDEPPNRPLRVLREAAAAAAIADHRLSVLPINGGIDIE